MNRPHFSDSIKYQLALILIATLIITGVALALRYTPRAKPAPDAPLNEIVSYCLAEAYNVGMTNQTRLNACLAGYHYAVKR